jgi:hypothetical protein
MKQPAVLCAIVITAVATGAFAQSSSSSSSSSSSGGSSVSSSGTPNANQNCKTVYLKPGEQPPSSGMTSSVTAGGGQVSGYTTGAGSSVNVQSGTGTGSAAMSSSTQDGRTVVTSSNGDCTIYIHPK